jgi:hypothetical protein
MLGKFSQSAYNYSVAASLKILPGEELLAVCQYSEVHPFLQSMDLTHSGKSVLKRQCLRIFDLSHSSANSFLGP